MCKARLRQENKKRGAVTIIIALLLSSMLLIIGFGVSTLMFQQLKMSGQAGRSVAAFYAADSATEMCLYDIFRNTNTGCDGAERNISGTLDGDVSYVAEYDGSRVRAKGTYADTTRALELAWE